MSAVQANPRRTSGATSVAADLLSADACYVVTVMLYQFLRPVSRTESLITALVSFGALTIAVFSDLGIARFPVNTLVAGLGWLTYLYPPLARRLGVLAMAPGMIGEGMLTLWLLAAGVDAERSRAQGQNKSAQKTEDP
jgi:hypothetical protein